VQLQHTDAMSPQIICLHDWWQNNLKLYIAKMSWHPISFCKNHIYSHYPTYQADVGTEPTLPLKGKYILKLDKCWPYSMECFFIGNMLTCPATSIICFDL